MDADHWDKLEADEPHKDSNIVDDIWSGEALRKDVYLQSIRFLALGIQRMVFQYLNLQNLPFGLCT